MRANIPATEINPQYNEPIVAYDQETGENLCNTQIFERKLKKLQFIALVVKEIRNRFNSEFLKYKDSMNHLGENDP